MKPLAYHPEAVDPEVRAVVRRFCTAEIPSKRSKRSLRVLEAARRFTVPTPYGPVVAYDWAPGESRKPIVLLCHGWSDSAATWIAFNKPLTDAGYRIVAFDQPAHGATAELTGISETIFTRLLAATESMMAWARSQGTVRAVIGHSVGALGGFLTSCRIAPERLVCIAMPPAVTWFIDHFAEHKAMDERTRGELWMHLGRRFRDDMGPDYPTGQLDSVQRAADLSIPVLFVQDDADRDVPLEAIHRTIDAARTAGGTVESLDTQGLGHQLVLRAPVVLERVIGFLEQEH